MLRESTPSKEAKGARILLIHPSPADSQRLAGLFARCGVDCRLPDLGPWADTGGTDASPRLVAVGVTQGASLADAVTRARRTWPQARVLAITPPGDARATRDALLAGAYDSLEESAADSMLMQQVCEALEQRDPRGLADNRAASASPGHGALPYRAFIDRLADARESCRRSGESIAILMLDLDRFRACNEVYSPAFGDEVLAWFESLLGQVFWGQELITRQHGDRFLVALCGMDRGRVMRLAEECRMTARRNPPRHRGRTHEFGVSIGVCYLGRACAATEHTMIHHARLALEDAKSSGRNQTRDWDDLVANRVRADRQQARGVDEVTMWIGRTSENIGRAYVEAAHALVAAAEAKEAHARRHADKVSTIAEAIARNLGMRPQLVGMIRTAAQLHDVGKIGVPDAILTKPGPLTADEFEAVKRHPVIAVEILGQIRRLHDKLPSILHHHERYDGTGYPAGLTGSDIPVGARVIAVADAIDVMISGRCYQEAIGVDAVRSELDGGAGRQFDPAVVEAAMPWLSRYGDEHAALAPAPPCTKAG